MEIVRRIQAMTEASRRARARGLRIAFVPTMGSLHEGHLSLIRRAREVSDLVVVSVFVNPMQFGAGEDFDSYPRDLARDADLCVAEGVEFLFSPSEREIYPDGATTFVEVAGLSDRLEGVSRPGHLRGVATVVLKLFEVVRPQFMVFGQKDAQQAVLVRRMVRDLLLGVEVLVAPTVRDENGLALSSRNRYLSDEDRAAARVLPRALGTARDTVGSGTTTAEAVLAAVQETLDAEPQVEVDYTALVDPETFDDIERIESQGLLLLAARCGATRLIDNALLTVDSEATGV